MGRFLFWLGLLIVIGFSGGMFYASYQKGQTASSAYAAEDISVSPINRCVNLGGGLEAPNEGDWGYRVRARDFALIRESGFDTIRVPIKWSAHVDNEAPYTIAPRILARVRRITEWASENDLNVIINVHHFDEISEDAGANIPKLYAIWDQLIREFGDAPDNVIFEFLNEPHSSMTIDRVDEVNRELLAKVRAHDADRWVILGGGEWGTLDGLLKTAPPHDPRAIVTFHYYSPFEFTHQGAPWAHKKIPLGQTWGTSADRKALVKDFARAAEWRNQVGMPLLVGEFGVYVKVPHDERAAWSREVRKASEDQNFGWCYWDYATSLGIYDQNSERFYPGMLEALIPTDVSQVQ